MNIETDPAPPVPRHTPPVDEKEPNKKFRIEWQQWFEAIRSKINVLNESLVNLADVSGNGLLVKNGAAWVLRVLSGTTGRVTVSNGDGASGDPTVDVVTADLIPGDDISFGGSGADRVIDNGAGPLTINYDGPKLPPGGTTGQILVKLSNTDYDVGWVDP